MALTEGAGHHGLLNRLFRLYRNAPHFDLSGSPVIPGGLKPTERLELKSDLERLGYEKVSTDQKPITANSNLMQRFIRVFTRTGK